MNVHIISPQLYPCFVGGVEIFNFYFADELSRRGINVTVHTQCNSETIKHISKEKKTLRNKIPIISQWASIIYNIATSKSNDDILHVPYTSNSPLVYPILFLRYLFKVPYVVVIHGGGLKPWKYPRIHKKFFINASSIVAVSNPIKDEYERRTGKKITVIPPLIPFEKSLISKENLKKKYGLKPEEIAIVSVGSIKKIKGSDILLEAFIQLGKKRIKEKKLHLVYAGDGELRAKLESQAKEHDLAESVTFLGTIPHSQIPEIFKMADIYVIPSLFEGTPISLLEAMFNGLPIVGANTKGINSIISHGKNGLLFERENANDLKRTLDDLLVNFHSHSKLGEEAFMDYRSQWNYQKAIDEHIAIMKEIIGGS